MLAVTGALETCATRNCYFAQNNFAQNYHFLDLISNNREKCNVIPDLWSFQNSDLVILRIICLATKNQQYIHNNKKHDEKYCEVRLSIFETNQKNFHW